MFVRCLCWASPLPTLGTCDTGAYANPVSVASWPTLGTLYYVLRRAYAYAKVCAPVSVLVCVWDHICLCMRQVC